MGNTITDCNKYGLYGALSCDPDREYQAGLCYLKPKPGFNCTVTACSMGSPIYQTGTIPDQCPPGYRNVAGVCWPDCPRDFEDIGVSCKKPGPDVSNSSALICPPGTEQRGLLCYDLCPQGYERRNDNIEFCSSICPEGTLSIGVGGCQKQVLEKRNNGVCPSDRQLEAGLCYTTPKPGFDCFVTSCSKPNIQSQIGTPPVGCSGDREMVGRLCYPKCNSNGYERKGYNLEFCTNNCPDGFTDLGVIGCERPRIPKN